ncbi:MAG: hypothetical protein R2867_32370 [Caldilineaceae bacterium]
MSSMTTEVHVNPQNSSWHTFIDMNKAKKALVLLLGFNGLMQLAIAGMMLADFEMVATSMFNITYTAEIAILGVALGTNVLFSGIIALLSIVWMFQGEQKGTSLGMLFGWLALTAGLMAYFKLGNLDGLLIDVTRGTLILILGYLARR